MSILKALTDLPLEPQRRVNRLLEVLRPQTDGLTSDAQALRCWFALLDPTQRPLLDVGVDRLWSKIREETWDQRQPLPSTWVTVAALSFARGQLMDGLNALVAWDGEGGGSDPWVDAARFWRNYVVAGRATAPSSQENTTSATSLLSRLAILAEKKCVDAAEVEALRADWVALAAPWLFDPVEVVLAGTSVPAPIPSKAG